MPELPEVETTLRGIRPHLEGRRIERLVVRQPRLRLPIPADLPERLAGLSIGGLTRRAKYLLVEVGGGCLILHLGMSGSLRLVTAGLAPTRHDHVDLVLTDGRALRLHDPRRFGLLIWTPDPPAQAATRHPLLRERGAAEVPFIRRVADHLSPRCALVPWLPEAPVGVDGLSQLTR